MTWRSAVSLFGAGSNDFLRIWSRPDHAPVGQGAASPVGSVEHRVTGDEPSVGRGQETKLAHAPDPKGRLAGVFLAGGSRLLVMSAVMSSRG
jgi:hypothetical protein